MPMPPRSAARRAPMDPTADRVTVHCTAVQGTSASDSTIRLAVSGCTCDPLAGGSRLPVAPPSGSSRLAVEWVRRPSESEPSSPAALLHPQNSHRLRNQPSVESDGRLPSGVPDAHLSETRQNGGESGRLWVYHQCQRSKQQRQQQQQPPATGPVSCRRDRRQRRRFASSPLFSPLLLAACALLVAAAGPVATGVAAARYGVDQVQVAASGGSGSGGGGVTTTKGLNLLPVSCFFANKACDFAFNNSLGAVPLFMLVAMQPNVPFSPGIIYSKKYQLALILAAKLKPACNGVNVWNKRLKACPSFVVVPPSSISTSPSPAVTTCPSIRLATTTPNLAMKTQYSGACFTVSFSQLTIKMGNGPKSLLRLMPSDGNAQFPEKRRCVVFRTI
eukprot:TRINITY_DN5735_c0_g3_i1.p1 TRINITY_DN5735_c0_g3~~TRINITY_DN5735_c0_g3_i1.p1  ORF type:complete len:389 (-),score=-43.16 TRINITY_DN5735_c0_g3_i1:53-1219(-)